MTPSKNKRKSAPQDSDEGEEVNFSDEEGGLRVEGIYIPPPPQPYCSVENKGPRLMITRITNKFFKSYAGTQVLGPFHKCFNAIVGPNGSGKSNVIDSMLFVFGFRASKIRSKKISVLLHNSEQYRNVQSCTVSVHFALIVDKEGDDYDIVPNSEFIVSRTAHKDNSSYYTLDGRKTQFKDIAVLLKSHGIDLDHNRFLILQGEVEQISLMAPKGNENEPGMLEYLEDIIGTTRYKLPLSQLAERGEQLSEQRAEKLNRLKLVQNELDELKEPMEEAVGFLKLENNIVTKRNLLYQKQIVVLEESGKSLEESHNDVEQGLQALLEKLNALKEEKNTRTTILKEASRKRENLVKRKEALNEAFDKANNKDIQLGADMQQTNKNRKKTKELLAEERRKVEQYEQTPEDTAKRIAECEKVTERMTTKKEGLEEDKIKLLANLRNQTKDLQEKKEAIQTRLVKLNKVVDETKSAFTLAESELKLYMSNQENETTKFENMRNTYETSETKITQHTNEIQKLKTQIPTREKRLKDSNEQLLAIRNEEINVVNELRRKRGILEESKSSLQASKSKGRVLDALMQQKREGKCPGLFGRLGDLGAIDEKYDVAVSTACGALDNIVVDTVNTAQWCIEFLKKHDIGRATIIALEKQEHLRRYYESRIKTPENVPRLFDLIRIEDDRVRPAFYYGLRDTLVADNLDQGSRIAYGAQRYRVVTLGGDLIETTGTMSGGGRQVSKGRMGRSVATTNVNPKDLEKLERDVQALEQKLREFRERQTALENELNELTPELRQMKVALEKYSIELQSLKQQQPALSKQLKIQEAKMKSTKVDPVQMKKLTDVVNRKKVDYDEAAANSSVLQKEVDLLTKEIKEKTQGKVQALDKNLREVNQTIEKCKSEITRLRVGLKTAERNIIKSKEKIATMEQDITNAENNMMRMKGEREEIESDAKKLLTLIEEIAANITDAEDEEGVVKKEVEVMTKKENKLKAEKIEIDQKAKTVREKVEEMKSKIHHWRVKITQLKYQDIPEETLPELKTYTNEELAGIEQQTVQRQLQALEEEFKSAKPNLNAIMEFRKKQAVYIGRMKELEEVTDKRKKMRAHYDNLHQRRKDEFLTGYNIIKMKLKEMYQMITLGGDADFEMLDTFDPFNEGIQFRLEIYSMQPNIHLLQCKMVRPPKKTWKLITNLSGGEKTLSSLALVFALHYYKPSPLYVMDEIDAALDFKNVSIVGNYIKDRTKNAQFIIISLRSNMFELCDYLIGIYKTLNCTKSVCIDPRQYDNKPENERRGEVPVNDNNRNENVVTSSNNLIENNTINESENCVVSPQKIVKDPRTAKQKVVSPNDRNETPISAAPNNEKDVTCNSTINETEPSKENQNQNILNDPRPANEKSVSQESMMDVSNESEMDISISNASRAVIPESSMEEGMESMEVDD